MISLSPETLKDLKTERELYLEQRNRQRIRFEYNESNKPTHDWNDWDCAPAKEGEPYFSCYGDYYKYWWGEIE